MGPSARFAFLKKLLPWLAPASSASEDIRTEMADSLASAESGAPVSVDEFTDPAAPDTAGLHAAAASTNGTDQVYLTADLIAGGKTALAAFPRNVNFTVAGGTAAHAPTSAVIVGTDINGDALTENFTITASAGTYEAVKAFKTITSITLSGGTGTGATVAIGFGKKFGLSKKIKSRAGRPAILQEVAVGAEVTTGTYVSAATSPPNGTYAPSAAPDAAKDYAVTYERDVS